MSYDFDMGLGSSYGSYTGNFETNPTYYTPSVKHEASNWNLQLYYIGALVISIIGIITSAGQIATWFYGDFSKLTASQSQVVDAFFALAWLTLILCGVLFCFSVYALARKMGFDALLQHGMNKAGIVDEFGQSSLDAQSSPLPPALALPENPYPGVL